MNQGTEGTAKTAELPGKIQRDISEAARQSANQRYPAITPDLASANHGYRMEHELGFERGAAFGYGLASQFLPSGVMDGKYSWEKIGDEYQVRHKDGKQDTFIAKSYTAEKAHFLAYAANNLSESGQEQGQAADWKSLVNDLNKEVERLKGHIEYLLEKSMPEIDCIKYKSENNL